MSGPRAAGVQVSIPLPISSGTIVAVHNLRNRLFLPEHGLSDIPLMVSVADIVRRPYLQRSMHRGGIKAHLGIRGPVLIDSGGFSFMADRQAQITVDELIALYEVLNADVFAALDLPPTPDDDATTRAQKWRMTLAHLDQMLEALGDGRLMPVIHGRGLDEVTAACREVHRRIDRPSLVALGGMVPFLRGRMSRERFSYRRPNGSIGSGVDFVIDALAVCRSEFPHSRLHVFGSGSPTTAVALLAVGADSVDSLAWRRAAGYGTIFLPGCAERIVSSRTRQRLSRPTISPADQPILEACVCPICSRHPSFEDRIGALARSYIARGVHNVWTLFQEERALRAAREAGTLGPFLASRVRGRHRFSKALMLLHPHGHEVGMEINPIRAFIAEDLAAGNGLQGACL